MLKIMMGNADCLSAATSNWMELFVSHFLYLRPFTKVSCFTYCLCILYLSLVVFVQSLLYHVSLQGLEGMHNLAQKCIQLKPVNTSHKLLRLLIGILGDNTEVRNGFLSQ